MAMNLMAGLISLTKMTCCLLLSCLWWPTWPQPHPPKLLPIQVSPARPQDFWKIPSKSSISSVWPKSHLSEPELSGSMSSTQGTRQPLGPALCSTTWSTRKIIKLGWWGQGKIVIVYFRGEGPLPRRPSREHNEREKQTGRRSPRSTHPSQQAWNNDGWKLNQESKSINENLTPARVHSTAWNFSFRKSVFRLNTWGEHKIFSASTPETRKWV